MKAQGVGSRRLSLDRVVDGAPLRVIAVADLLHEKLRAGTDPTRRRSKRLQDLADVEALLEERPDLDGELSAEERGILKPIGV